MDVDTQLAKNLYRDVAIFVVAGAVVGGIDWWLELLTLPDENRQLVAIGLSLVLVLMISVVCIAHRRTIAHMLMPAEGQANPLLLSLARSWFPGQQDRVPELDGDGADRERHKHNADQRGRQAGRRQCGRPVGRVRGAVGRRQGACSY